MTLYDILTATKERFSNAKDTEVCRLVNEVESRLIDEIFSPHGIEVRTERLDPQTDINSSLILDDEDFLLYVYFVFSIFAVKELDFSTANAYSVAFNEKFSQLSVRYRRKFTPVKNIPLKGGI